MTELTKRIDLLKHRLQTAYDGIGHSYGRPYVYFVYPPDQERFLRSQIDDAFVSSSLLTFYHLDVLAIVMQSTASQEERREALLGDPTRGAGAATSILGLWSRQVSQAIAAALVEKPPQGRPVAVLRGLAALHPLGTPTNMMESIAEEEPRDPATDKIIPIVLLVPGIRPPQSSRVYWFLGQERLRQEFYRGEEV